MDDDGVDDDTEEKCGQDYEEEEGPGEMKSGVRAAGGPAGQCNILHTTSHNPHKSIIHRTTKYYTFKILYTDCTHSHNPH